MTVKEAFEILLSDKQKCSEIGMRESNYRMTRKRLRDNDPLLTLQAMLAWLEKAGWTYEVEVFPPLSKKS